MEIVDDINSQIFWKIDVEREWPEKMDISVWDIDTWINFGIGLSTR